MMSRLELQILMAVIAVQTCANSRSPHHSLAVNQVACELSHSARASCLHVVVEDDCRAVANGEDIGRKGSLRERYVELAAQRIPGSVVRLRLALRSPCPSN